MADIETTRRFLETSGVIERFKEIFRKSADKAKNKELFQALGMTRIGEYDEYLRDHSLCLERMRKRIQLATEQIYSDLFTDSEIEELQDFYKTPAGKEQPEVLKKHLAEILERIFIVVDIVYDEEILSLAKRWPF